MSKLTIEPMTERELIMLRNYKLITKEEFDRSIKRIRDQEVKK